MARETAGLTLTGSAQQLDSIGGTFIGITIRAGANEVYFGFRDTITAGTVDATSGHRIPANEKEFIKVDNASKIYVIGTNTDKITYIIE